MDISVYSLAQVLQFMNDQKYILIEDVQVYDENRDLYDYVLVDVYDSETNDDAKTYAEYGYSIQKFQTLEDAMDTIECIFCGGLYTAVYFSIILLYDEI